MLIFLVPKIFEKNERKDYYFAMKTCLLSVYEKAGIVEFAKALLPYGYKIISTGGTARLLKENSVPVIPIEEVTGFPEVLEGRVKTLHPKIFAGILSCRDKELHNEQLKKYNIQPIDIVVVNLYPFEKVVMEQEKYHITDEVIENIDIGGVALLRAAAKNFKYCAVVCDPKDYDAVVEKIKEGGLDLEFRRRLAAKAFRYTAYYDSLISRYFTEELFPETITLGLKYFSDLRYGENPHQKACLYKLLDVKKECPLFIIDAKQLQGKELSYNNWLDLYAAYSLVNEFSNPAAVIIKHNNPCGVAESETLKEAYINAYICDKVSAFGGIIGLNRVVDKETAEEITKIFVECVIAPDYTDEALAIFSAKPNIRVMKLPNDRFNLPKVEYRDISGGFLVEERDVLVGLDNLSVVTARKPSDEELESLKFAWKVVKNVKSNGIVLVKGRQTVGIGVGQMSRIDSLKIAKLKMSDIMEDIKKLSGKPLVLASDAFFPFPDVVEESAKIGVTAIIQPGGSLKDNESIAACNKYNITMVFTGIRHFKH
jgi:phosphoribosylaminoimidazolecarboxamide formyltransferase/IMP cyclohydrolase